MQRGKACPGGIRIGAAVEQQLDDVGEAGMGRGIVALTPQASASFTFAPAPTSSFADRDRRCAPQTSRPCRPRAE